MKTKTKILPNRNTNLKIAIIVEGDEDKNEPDELYFTPIIGWCVKHEFMEWEKDSYFVTIPIGIGERGDYDSVIFDVETEQWEYVSGGKGVGKEDLLVHMQMVRYSKEVDG